MEILLLDFESHSNILCYIKYVTYYKWHRLDWHNIQIDRNKYYRVLSLSLLLQVRYHRRNIDNYMANRNILHLG